MYVLLVFLTTALIMVATFGVPVAVWFLPVTRKRLQGRDFNQRFLILTLVGGSMLLAGLVAGLIAGGPATRGAWAAVVASVVIFVGGLVIDALRITST